MLYEESSTQTDKSAAILTSSEISPMPASKYATVKKSEKHLNTLGLTSPQRELGKD
jgi:hypothetical protein